MGDDKTFSILIKLKADVDEALGKLKAGKGGIDEVGKSAEASGGLIDGLMNSLKSLAGPVLAYFSATGLASFIRESISAFSDAEAASLKLGSEITIMGGDFNAVRPAIDKVKTELSAYGITASQVDNAIASLLTRNFGLQQSLDATRAALKLSTVEGIPFSQALDDIVRATEGTLRPNSLLGQILSNVRAEIVNATSPAEKFALVMQALSKLDAPFASMADSTTTKMRTMGAAWTEFKELVGNTSWVQKIVDALENWTTGLHKFNEEAERSRRIAEGKGTSADNIEEMTQQRDALAAYRQSLKQGEYFNPASVSDTGLQAIVDSAKFIGVSDYTSPTDQQKELLIGGFADLIKQLNVKIFPPV